MNKGNLYYDENNIEYCAVLNKIKRLKTERLNFFESAIFGQQRANLCFKN